MIATLMIYSLVVGTVLGVSAVVADRIIRTSAVATRWTWFGAMVVLVMLTLSAPWRTEEIPALRASDEASSHANVALLSGAGVAPMQSQSSGSSPTLVTQAVHSALQLTSRIPRRLDRSLGIAWIAGTALMFLWFAFGVERLARRCALLPRVRMQGFTVCVSKSSGPAVYGVLSPEIVVPAAALQLSAREQRLLLAHEDSHRHARDPLLLATSAILLALIPWHPIAWWLAARVRLAVELDCDARVLRANRSPRAYANLLLVFAERVRRAPSPVGVSALLASRGHLERRLLAMTVRPSRSRLKALSAAAVVVAAAGLVACSAPVPAAAEREPSALSLVVTPQELFAGAGAFTIDGKPATLAQAYALTRDQVAQVSIESEAPSSVNRTMKLTTRSNSTTASDQLLVMGYSRRVSADEINAERARRDSLMR